jgi:chitin synthase
VPEKKLLATLPIEQNIAWQWAIIIAFSIPELGAWLRALRLCIFKKIKSFKWEEFGIVMGMETLYVIGMCLFVFAVLPEVDVIQGVMLTNCLCLIPAVLGNIFSPPSNYLNLILSVYYLQTCCRVLSMNRK